MREALLRYCPICDGYEASGRSVCVIGPMDHAIAKARFLRTFAETVLLVATDRDPMPGEAVEMERLGVKVRRGASEPLTKEGTALTVTFAEGGYGRFDIIYPAMGVETATGLIAGLGLETDDAGLIAVDGKNRTSLAGVFAAGDAVSDLHQIAVAVGHAAVASTAMHNALPANPS